MGKVIQFPPEKAAYNRHWNRGYSDGYQQNETKTDQPDAYYTGYVVGTEDRIEDEEAMASGDFDTLDEAEREYLYGNESDGI